MLQIIPLMLQKEKALKFSYLLYNLSQEEMLFHYIKAKNLITTNVTCCNIDVKNQGNKMNIS